jgi:gluconate 2-dehydrogenase gamma chain
MSAKETDRRAFLKASVLLPSAAALSASTAVGQPPLAVDDPARSAPGPSAPAADDYRPAFFTAPEWAFVQAACARIIPNDANGPGALEAGVPQFIDRQMGSSYGDAGSWYMSGPFYEGPAELGYQSQLTPKQQYRLGIRAIEAWCGQTHNKSFADLTPEQQDEALKAAEAGDIKADDVSPKTFFTAFLLKNVMEGFFGDPMYGGNRDMAGWKLIGHPGGRGDFGEFIDKPVRYAYGPVDMYGRRG